MEAQVSIREAPNRIRPIFMTIRQRPACLVPFAGAGLNSTEDWEP
jgi:hypothetical protein